MTAREAAQSALGSLCITGITPVWPLTIARACRLCRMTKMTMFSVPSVCLPMNRASLWFESWFQFHIALIRTYKEEYIGDLAVLGACLSRYPQRGVGSGIHNTLILINQFNEVLPVVLHLTLDGLPAVREAALRTLRSMSAQVRLLCVVADGSTDARLLF